MIKKIDIKTDTSSHRIFRCVDKPDSARPIIRPSQFFGMVGMAIYGDRSADVTMAEHNGEEVPPHIIEEHKELCALFSKFRILSVTRSIGKPYKDYCTPLPLYSGIRKWDGSPLRNLKGEVAKKPLMPFGKTYWRDGWFTIYLDGSEEAVTRVVNAMRNPRGRMYVGRKCCPVCELWISDVDDGELESYFLPDGSHRCMFVGSQSEDWLRGIQNGNPAKYQLPVYPDHVPGKWRHDYWFEIVPGVSRYEPNSRLANLGSNFIYVFDHGGRGRSWSHKVVCKYFGKDSRWYINGRDVIVYSNAFVGRCGDLKVMRFKVRGSRGQMVSCVYDYIPKCYGEKHRREMAERQHSVARQKMTKARAVRLAESLGLGPEDLSLLGCRRVNPKGDIKVWCWRFGFEIDAADLVPLLFERHGGKFASYGYGCIRCDLDAIA